MRLPPESAHYSHRIRYGRYVARRLRQSKRLQLAETIEAATQDVLEKGRAVEDAAGPVQEALADRDAIDENLDAIAKNARLALASRSLDAIKTAPYTLIFHAGIDYYTSARVDEEAPRYGELKGRLVEHLPDTDEVRMTAVPALEAGIGAFKAAVDTVSNARNAESRAKTLLDAAEEDWARLLTKTYGSLIGDLGRAAAERFFPKLRNRAVADEDPGE